MHADSYLTLEKISAYTQSFELSQLVWQRVQRWEYFSRAAVGQQFVRAIDSISANIAEGFGRYYKREKIQFYRYSIGSVFESIDWCQKAQQRGLLNKEDAAQCLLLLRSLPQQLRYLIYWTNTKLKT